MADNMANKMANNMFKLKIHTNLMAFGLWLHVSILKERAIVAMFVIFDIGCHPRLLAT